jgi:hypothetical protein
MDARARTGARSRAMGDETRDDEDDENDDDDERRRDALRAETTRGN